MYSPEHACPARCTQPQTGTEKNDQDDQATGDTVPGVRDMFNLAKTKAKMFPLENIAGR